MLHAHLDAMDMVENALIFDLLNLPMAKKKSLRTNHACTLCGLYVNYSHHCQDLAKFWTAMSNIWKHSLEFEITIIEEIHPSVPSSYTMTIYMVSISNDPSTSETIDDPSALSNIFLVMKKK